MTILGGGYCHEAPPSRWINWGSEKLGDSLKVIQLVSSGNRIQTQNPDPLCQRLCSIHHTDQTAAHKENTGISCALEWGPRARISDKFPGDTDAAGQGSDLWEQLTQGEWPEGWIPSPTPPERWVRCTLKGMHPLLNQHYSALERHISSVSLRPWDVRPKTKV